VQRGLGDLLKELSLVVLDVCEGASTWQDAPAARLVAAGAPACVAPRLSFAEEASGVFCSALYRTLTRGESLLECVEAGRRALTLEVRVPHPHWRWWNPALVIGSAGTPVGPPPLCRPALPGWPAGGRSAAPIVDVALERGAAHGFVGVEHLALALADRGGPGLRVAGLRQALEPVERALARLTRKGPISDPPPLSCRLQALGARLPVDFDASLLAALVLDSPALAGLLGRRLDALREAVLATDWQETLESTIGTADLSALFGRPRVDPAEVLAGSHEELPEGDLVLEVLGGPDDGRLLVLTRPDQVLGRWDPTRPEEQASRLFRPPAPWDSRISRRHLVYLGQGRLRVERRVCLRPAAGAERRLDPGAELASLVAGDLLVLRDAVFLRVRRACPG